eukprot:Pgem_evm1s132
MQSLHVNINNLNNEQSQIFQYVKAQIDGTTAPNNTHNVLFLDGPGGCGKTHLYNIILAYTRSQRKIALASAGSGVRIH